MMAAHEGQPELAGQHANKVRGDQTRTYVQPGVIAPGDTWSIELDYHPDWLVEQPQSPRMKIARMVVTDAAGRQWTISPGRAVPARRVHRWQRRRLV